MAEHATLLLIVSDALLAEQLARYLHDAGYHTIVTAQASEALRVVRARHPDLLILDSALAGGTALQLCVTIRRETGVPFILLTDSHNEAERIQGLDLGADLCLNKPVSLAELRARVRALLRRAFGLSARQPQSFAVGHLRLDLDQRRAWAGECELHLTVREFDLLAYLMRHSGMVLPRAQLLRDVWGERLPQRSRTLEVHIRWLRQKVELNPAKPSYIRTVRQIGYRFDAS